MYTPYIYLAILAGISFGGFAENEPKLIFAAFNLEFAK